MSQPETVSEYLQQYSQELGNRILTQFPALHGVGDPVSPLVRTLLRKPFAAQATVLMGLVRSWENGARNAIVLGEMGTGKTLISLGTVHVHSERRPCTALAMVPPHLVNKWAREAMQTIPRIRVFLLDGFRDSGTSAPNGIREVRLKRGRIVSEGLSTTLSDLRLRGNHRNARKRWLEKVRQPNLIIVGRETAKLGPAWEHVYRIAQSGSNRGRLVNPDTGIPVLKSDGTRLTVDDFGDFKRAEKISVCGERPSHGRYSALWQVDREKIRRIAPIDFIGRYMDDFFDYAICDEVHQLAHMTAQGNALGILASCTKHLLGLTGTLVDGYAGHLFNILFRLTPHLMREAGYEFSASGRAAFIDEYGVLEQIETTAACDNKTSDARTTHRVRERPGASPRLFGDQLLPQCAFIFLKDIAEHLPAYTESVIPVAMDDELRKAYQALEEDAKRELRANRGSNSVLSTLMHALLLYPNHPFGMSPLFATRWDKKTKRRGRFVVARPAELSRNVLYPKESTLIEDIKQELAEGRRCQIYAVYKKTQERLKQVLERAGLRVAWLTVKVRPSQREAWYARQVEEGFQVALAHPKLVETGLDLLDFPTLYFYETGHSLPVMRQASRRSWRIGQRLAVRVKFFVYAGTAQDLCLELMFKKLLVALTTEGQFCGEGVQDAEEDESDILAAVARGLMKQDIGETAEAAWRTLRETEAALATAGLVAPAMASASFGEETMSSEFPDEEDEVWHPPSVPVIDPGPMLIFGERPEGYVFPRRRPRVDVAGQGSLFDCG
jgi:superfamily II DNA or RNA helicase